MSKEKYGVHIAHCCYIHGCKYGDEDCPVASGEVAQKYLCYYCDEEDDPYTIEEIELLRKTKSYRPTYEQLKNRVADLETKLAEGEKEHELLINQFEEETEKLRKQIKQESDARKRFVEEVKNLKQQLAEKEKELFLGENK